MAMGTKFTFGIGIVIIVLIAAWTIGQREVPSTSNPTPTSTPIVQLPHADLIRITSPQPNATLGHSFEVTGEARGNWYFEASFPVSVEDASGTIIFSTPAQAQGEWMTTNFVPFTTQVTIPPTVSGPLTLVLAKDNPSGLPEHDASVRIPIVVAR